MGKTITLTEEQYGKIKERILSQALKENPDEPILTIMKLATAAEVLNNIDELLFGKKDEMGDSKQWA